MVRRLVIVRATGRLAVLLTFSYDFVGLTLRKCSDLLAVCWNCSAVRTRFSWVSTVRIVALIVLGRARVCALLFLWSVVALVVKVCLLTIAIYMLWLGTCLRRTVGVRRRSLSCC